MLIEVKDKFTEDLLPEQGFAIVKFGAIWCAPCKMLEKNLKEWENDLPNIYSVNVDNDDESVSKYNISSVPVLLIFKDRKKINEHTGLISKEDLVKLIS